MAVIIMVTIARYYFPTPGANLRPSLNLGRDNHAHVARPARTNFPHNLSELLVSHMHYVIAANDSRETHHLSR